MGQGVLWLRYYYIHSCFIPCTHSLCGLSWNWSLATYLATSYVSAPAVLSPCKTNSQLHLLRGSLDKCITDQFHKQSIFLQPFCSSTAGDDNRHWNYTPMYQMEDGIGIGKLSEKKLLYRSRKNVCRKVHPSCFGNQPKSCEATMLCCLCLPQKLPSFFYC